MLLSMLYIFGLLIAQVVAVKTSEGGAKSSNYSSLFNSALTLNLDEQSSQLLCVNATFNDRDAMIQCTEEGPLLQFGYCATYNDETKLLSITNCPHYQPNGYNLSTSGQIVLPRNLSQLNEYMCGPLNRKGFVCSECADSFGPSLTSFGYKCANCTDVWYGVPLFLVVEFVPITVFYLIILVFQISVMSAPMPCFIMYAQSIFVAFYLSIYSDNELRRQIVFDKNGSLRFDMKIIYTIYGVFNLDFFRLVTPPFCISSHLKTIHIALFGYISVLYPLFLIFLTWVCVELHGRNLRPLVCLWRPFHGCFVRLRRGWDTKSDIIDVFLTFFLLSYDQCVYVTLVLMSYRAVKRYDEFGNFYNIRLKTVFDYSVAYGSTNHLIFAIPAAILFSIYTILLPVLLTFYPFKLFRSCLSKCRLDFISVNIFVEKVHNCYRNGLDGGRDFRSFSGLYFFLRMALYLLGLLSDRLLKVNNNNWMSDAIWFPIGTVFMITALTVALIKPYQKNYMNYLDALLLSNIALCCLVLKAEIRVLMIIRLLFFTPILILIFIVFTRMFFKVSTCCNSCNLWIHLRQTSACNLQGVAGEKTPIIKSACSPERSYDK